MAPRYRLLIALTLGACGGSSSPAPAPAPLDTSAPRDASAPPSDAPVPDAGGACAHPFGVIGGRHLSQDVVSGILSDLDARWLRMNVLLDGQDVDVRPYLESGFNLVLTVANRDPANEDRTYDGNGAFAQAGYPFVSKSAYQKDISDLLAPLLPYLSKGREIWVQCENEVFDARVNAKAAYWRGTDAQYMTQLAALFETVRAADERIPVVLSSFASSTLDAAMDPNDSRHAPAATHVATLLEGRYDAADLHFYGCPDQIDPKIRFIRDQLAPGKRWISTENGGPDTRCASTPAFSLELEAQQVPERLTACAHGGGSVCLWFSLFDEPGTGPIFDNLGLLTATQPPVQKPAYDAYKRLSTSWCAVP